MKLRTKKGFVNLNLVDSTGQNYTIDPKMDPFVHRSQVRRSEAAQLYDLSVSWEHAGSL